MHRNGQRVGGIIRNGKQMAAAYLNGTRVFSKGAPISAVTPQFVADATGTRTTATANTAVSITVPTVQAGDTLFLIPVIAFNGATFTVAGLEFTSYPAAARSGITSQMFSHRVASSAESGTVLTVNTSQALVFRAHLTVWRGFDEFTVAALATQGSTGTLLVPDYTPAAGTFPIQCIAVSRSTPAAGDFTAPAGITEVASFNPTTSYVTGTSWGIGAVNTAVGNTWGGQNAFISTGWTITATVPTPAPTGPDPMPPMDSMAFYDDFSRYADGTKPTTTAAGYKWGQWTTSAARGPGIVTGGYFDSAGNGAVYEEANMGSSQINRLSAEFMFDNKGGTLTTDGGTVAIAIWGDGGIVGSNAIGRSTPAHFVVTPTIAQLYVRETVNEPLVALPPVFHHSAKLAYNTVYRADVLLMEGAATVRFSTGEEFTVVDPRINVRSGQQFVAWEPFYNNVTTDVRARIKRVAADGNGFSPAALAPATPLPLPFKLDRQAIKDSPKKAFAHYFGPFPISVQNDAMPDYWHRIWNLAASTYVGHGGYTRNRPFFRAPRPSTTWKADDARDEVRMALDVQLDGFFCNTMGLTGLNQDRYVAVRNAANELAPDGTFKVVPMIDTNGSVGTATPAELSNLIAAYCWAAPVRGKTTGNTVLPSAWFDGGVFIVSSYKADGKTAAWWQAIFDDLLTQYGITAKLSAVLSNFNNAAGLSAVSVHESLWGSGADPSIARAYGSTMPNAARSRGKKWMSPVWPQDMRPEGGLFDESRGTESLREYWGWVITQDADFVQICTWSDYREGGEARPSVKKGWSVLDLSAWFIHRWKTGKDPVIEQEGFYLSHRNQLTGLPRTAFRATAQGAYPVGFWAANTTTGKAADGLMGHWLRSNRSSLANMVEVVSFFKEPTDVEVKVGATVNTFTHPAGMFAKTWPLAAGTITVTARRGGQVVEQLTSPAVVTNTPYNQDMGYHTFSTFPGRRPDQVGQYDYQASLT